MKIVPNGKFVILRREDPRKQRKLESANIVAHTAPSGAIEATVIGIGNDCRTDGPLTFEDGDSVLVTEHGFETFKDGENGEFLIARVDNIIGKVERES